MNTFQREHYRGSELFFAALLSGCLTFSVSWMILETNLPSGRVDTLLESVLFVLIYAVPVGLSAWLVWRTSASWTNLAGIGGISAVVFLSTFFLNSELIFLLSFLLFALPAFVVGRVSGGLFPAIVCTYLPVGGLLFAVPLGQLGSVTLLDRVSTAVFFGVPVVGFACLCYLAGRKTGQ
ncbi:hypothetical protein HALLA_20765 (plasmid) [Halostagnicola larsenii XH-48]|uniref:Uncharacterized protein n=1 Tax=Halostagnicola larsenii XH-48 TaxID=797299 RepID=W0JZG4_9EURY|nr:hypothetical protein [Halostagnicola larsenii]AHG02338.1 hypothetical protein HALLA_20765 [Halostagnicola larsenii XH-48]